MPPWPGVSATFEDVSQRLIEIGRRFDARGWVSGTSGNFSGVVAREPLRLAITASGTAKGELSVGDILEIDGNGEPARATIGRPSAETRLHLEIIRHYGAGAVLHTHSMWSTLLSDRYAAARGLGHDDTD